MAHDICKRYMKVAYAHTGVKKAIFTRLRCKQWSCEACAKMNAWIWRNWLIKRLPKMGDEWWILTLTANSRTRERVTSMDNLRTNLDAFFKRVKRVFGHIEYVRVYEKHPTSDAVHVHIVICGLAPFVKFNVSKKGVKTAKGTYERKGRKGTWTVRTWVKKNAGDLKMGYIADVQKIQGEPVKAVWYVTKYLTKAQADLHVKGLRHVQVTSGIGSPKNEAEFDYEWNVTAYIVADMFEAGAKILDINTGETIDNAHWENHSFYPVD